MILHPDCNQAVGCPRHVFPGHFPWRRRDRRLEGAAMTRTSIERCIWIFIVALSGTFLWTVSKVFAMLGWL
jgi:hypothetical protein